MVLETRYYDDSADNFGIYVPIHKKISYTFKNVDIFFLFWGVAGPQGDRVHIFLVI